jgi:RHS repeat-associated protein
VSASGAQSATLTYDPLGRLFSSVGSNAAGATRFHYDGDELIGEYDSAGNLARRYVHGAGNDDPLFWYEGSGLTERRSLHADHQGSIVALGSPAGTNLAINAYDAYGIPATTNLGRFGYTGQAWLSELGLYYYKARLYSPTLGRFLQTDPIGYEDGLNWIHFAERPALFLIGFYQRCQHVDAIAVSCYLGSPQSVSISRSAASWSASVLIGLMSIFTSLKQCHSQSVDPVIFTVSADELNKRNRPPEIKSELTLYPAPSISFSMPAHYTLLITPTPDDFDALNHVNNAVWVRWIQDVSTAHWHAVATPEQLVQYQWIVTRHEVDYRGNIAAGESVTARTWLAEPPTGARFDRLVDFICPRGKVIVRAKTTWALTDQASGRLLRIRSDITDRFGLSVLALDGTLT